MPSRRRVRRLTLQGLCCLDVRGEAVRDLVERFIADSLEGPATAREATALLREVWADHPACDELLVRHAKHWRLHRLALVDRNILRLAVHEIRAGRAPVKVAISEALRLAEEFSSAESLRFINGVLDAVAKDVSRDAGDSRDGDGATETK